MLHLTIARAILSVSNVLQSEGDSLCIGITSFLIQLTVYLFIPGFTMTSKLSQEQIDELKKNPFFDKYADKIAKLQK